MVSINIRLLITINALIIGLTQSSFAENKKTTSQKGPHKKAQMSLLGHESKTQHDFNDRMISGKYQYPDEAVVKVDDDKALTDLVGIRRDFKDRL